MLFFVKCFFSFWIYVDVLGVFEFVNFLEVGDVVYCDKIVFVINSIDVYCDFFLWFVNRFMVVWLSIGCIF